MVSQPFARKEKMHVRKNHTPFSLDQRVSLTNYVGNMVRVGNTVCVPFTCHAATSVGGLA